MKYSADAVYEVVIYYYDSVKSKCRRQCVFCGIRHLLCDVRVVPQSELQFGMPQHFLHITGIESVFRQHCGVGMPLRYNYDKPEKPRISRIFGYLARFFILFQTEKSSREVVIS